MAKNRIEKTLADYVVIAVSPALIMALVCSLVFFLLEVSYRGQFETRMHWIMFWFVFAAVLVARIAIEEGREHARMFGIAMCGVTALAIVQFVDAAIIGWILLAVIWWCSSKLTWDCTLIDDSEDASGEGLLQTAGFEKPKESPAEAESKQPSPKEESPVKRKKGNSKKSRKKSQSNDGTAEPTELKDEDSDQTKTQPHAPGLWVVFFSLAALPLFGVGQVFIPLQESGRRSYAFQLLAIYVASAIALLLTTSFLSLRRYLRQRKLEMPTSMALSWLGIGAALIVAFLLVALVVPRPQGEYTLTVLIDKIDAKARQASQYAVLKDDRADGQGRRIGEQDSTAKQPGEDQSKDPKSGQSAKDGTAGEKAASDGHNGKPGNDGEKGGKSSDGDKNHSEQRDPKGQSDKNADSSKGSKSSDQQNHAKSQQTPMPSEKGESRKTSSSRNTDPRQTPTQSPPKPAQSQSSNVAQWLAALAPYVKWILYGLLAITGIYFTIRHWAQFADFFVKLWTELLNLFGFKSRSVVTTDSAIEEPTKHRKRPFASYENPFFSGAADRMSPHQLVSYTFEALEAWSREQYVDRPPEQTPLEFAEKLGDQVPALAKDISQTAHLYAQVAYSNKQPANDRMQVLERLWRRMDVS